MEARESQAINRAELAMKRLRASEDTQIELERNLNNLEKKYIDLNEKFQITIQHKHDLEVQVKGAISRDRAE
jgi:hypothetical protein